MGDNSRSFNDAVAQTDGELSGFESPCTKVCKIDPQGDCCLGCGRTILEISEWPRSSEQMRIHIRARAAKRLASRRCGFALAEFMVLLAFAALLIGLFVPLAGCQERQNSNRKPLSLSDESFVIDRLQRRVQIGPPAKRIVSLAPATTELLFALGLGDEVVGATKYCNFPPEALDLPRVGGGSVESISVETLVGLKPDLVLCNWDTHQPIIETLERLQIRVCAIGAQSLEELYEDSACLGKLADCEQQAKKFVSRMRTRQAELETIVAEFQQEPKLRVFYEVWDEPLMTAAPNSFIGELLYMAGLENILSDTSVRYPRISSETIVDGDPQLILAPSSHLEKVDIDAFRSRPGWSSVTAVVDKRIHLISGDEISRCGPRILDALAEIIVAAYPEAKDLVAKASQIQQAQSERSP